MVNLFLENWTFDNTYSANVVGQITGSEKPDEIFLLGGHIDSWDTGSQTGANDDGGGFITTFETINVLLKLGLRPKRTIRFIAWSGEEFGAANNGAHAYVDRHKDELKSHVIAFESDLGSTTPFGFGYNGG